uniref:Uncharacterized protein n=2 Tax=viral metagenome TaxID=1070528 RepID=A0A6H2A4D1_9ZZZZ
MSLRRTAIRVVETYGLLHKANLTALRLYIKEHTEDELVKEVKDIREAPLLRALWEAGLSQRLQDAVMEQLGKIS